MSQLELAAERLTNALNALEGRLVPLGGARGDVESARADAEAARADAQSAKAQLAELHAERERLLARIAELEDEARLLGEISEEVENRLDGAIAEVRAALGR
jgi:chromosome segregation ATPase